MVPAPPPLPTRFPCWCRAVYSWGGESPRDLGFVEGDLIECLNAGDGSWWTGRLRRNKTVGVFPSNFVEVLPDNFRPVTRSISPLTSNNTPSPPNALQKTKSKPFRKPFEAYAKAPHYTTAKQPETYRDGQDSANTFRRSVHDIGHASTPPGARGYGSRGPSPAPTMRNYETRSSMMSSSAAPMSPYRPRATSPAPSRGWDYGHRSTSPAPPMSHYSSRDPSPAPSHRASYDARTPSPAPSFTFKPYRPAGERESSPPPPPPPPHRNLLTRGGSNASYESQAPPGGYHTPRNTSPCPPSPGGGGGPGFTPSPLREAMDGVIEQLDALGMPRGSQSPEPALDPWSPESFDLVQHRSRRKSQGRPQTAMGITQQDSGYESYGGESSQDNTAHGGYRGEHQLPQLSNYVERMENNLRKMHQHSASMDADDQDMGPPPLPPLKSNPHSRSNLRKKKSTYDTNSTNASSGSRSTVTNGSTNTQSTNRSLMSGVSAGGISATSAGSFARKHFRARSALGFRDGDEDEVDMDRPTTPFTGVSYHPSHSTSAIKTKPQAASQEADIGASAGLGGLVQPDSGTTKPKRSNFIKRILEATKTGVASNRHSIALGSGSMGSSPIVPGRGTPNRLSAIAGGLAAASPIRSSREMGMSSSGVDWVQVRRDVNRSNTLSRNERNERRDRCQMLDYPAIDPVDELYESVDGPEGIDGLPIREPVEYTSMSTVNTLALVDKNSRFISNLPPTIPAVTVATHYVCRPYKSEVQRIRAIFTWVAEKITWEEDFEGEVDIRRVIRTKRACAEEYAALVHEMCTAVSIPCEIVRGYLKAPGEVPETTIMPRSNHWWNAVLIDNEWRMIDCCLASPSNPRRSLYSGASNGIAEFWWFLTSPVELCWTHIPEHHGQQHICPPVAHETLLNLPCACPPYFKNSIAMVDYNTALIRIEDLEMVHIKFNVPADVEIAAEVEVRAYTRDSDGDVFENGEVVKKRALAQAEWYNGTKRYTVKALLPGDEGTGMLRVYAGKRGLMHSIKDIPHPLAFALPIMHTGENPPYEFVTRHPTPHAQRHDIYVVQPQCQRLALNNTFVFAIRQHPSSSSSSSSHAGGATSPIPGFARPPSAMSMTSGSATGSVPSSATGSIMGRKPAKLAIQTPGGKILRLMRKEDRKNGGIGVGGRSAVNADEEVSDGGIWETIIKCSERGVWRGLVLADRTARWCVFAEWVCQG
ncbi:hypothetical protein F4780DRAFT_789685 [Xylariomycetidae sp. FL0641]|nr:hypothetical protein F4780DRAFT_789685 [Xylariomycetidae sp. FL0641]